MRSIEGVDRVVKMIYDAGFHLPLREAMVWRHIELLGGRVRAIHITEDSGMVSVIIYMPDSFTLKDRDALLDDLGDEYEALDNTFSGRKSGAMSTYFASLDFMPRPKRIRR